MKKNGIARRGLNLGAVRAAMLCDWAATALVDFAAPDERLRRVTVAQALVWLDDWIAQADRVIAEETLLSTGSPRLTTAHHDAIVTVQVLREFRNFLTGEP